MPLNDCVFKEVVLFPVSQAKEIVETCLAKLVAEEDAITGSEIEIVSKRYTLILDRSASTLYLITGICFPSFPCQHPCVEINYEEHTVRYGLLGGMKIFSICDDAHVAVPEHWRDQAIAWKEKEHLAVETPCVVPPHDPKEPDGIQFFKFMPQSPLTYVAGLRNSSDDVCKLIQRIDFDVPWEKVESFKIVWGPCLEIGMRYQDFLDYCIVTRQLSTNPIQVLLPFDEEHPISIADTFFHHLSFRITFKEPHDGPVPKLISRRILI